MSAVRSGVLVMLREALLLHGDEDESERKGENRERAREGSKHMEAVDDFFPAAQDRELGLMTRVEEQLYGDGKEDGQKEEEKKQEDAEEREVVDDGALLTPSNNYELRGGNKTKQMGRRDREQ